MKRPSKPRPTHLELTAEDIMQTRIVSVSPTAPLSEVERLLAEHKISGMPVVDSAGRAVGVVSLTDLIEHYAEDPDTHPRRGHGYFRMSTEELAEEDLESFEVPEESEDTVEDVMTPEVIHVKKTASMQEIARTMTEHRIHRVLVTEPKTERVVGIISSMGVLAALAG